MRTGQAEPLHPLEYAEVLISYDQQDEEGQDDVLSNTLHCESESTNSRQKYDLILINSAA